MITAIAVIAALVALLAACSAYIDAAAANAISGFAEKVSHLTHQIVKQSANARQANEVLREAVPVLRTYADSCEYSPECELCRDARELAERAECILIAAGEAC